MSTPPNTQAPLLHAGPETRGPVVVVTTSVLLIIVTISTIIRLLDVIKQKRRLNVADRIMISANAFAIGQVVCVQLAAANGLGQHTASVDLPMRNAFFKYVYTSQLIAIIVETLAKISIVRFVCILNPHNGQHQHRNRWATTTFVLACAMFSFLSISLQCGVPSPWLYTAARCKNHDILFAVIGLDILTDIYLSTFFVPTVWRLQMPLVMRVSVAAFFLSRLLTCLAGAAKMATLPTALSSSDQLWSQVTVTLTTQLLLSLSMITANLPALKNFIYELGPGQDMSISPVQTRSSSYFATVSSHPRESKFIDRLLRRNNGNENHMVPDEGIMRVREIRLASDVQSLGDEHIAPGVPRSGVFDSPNPLQDGR